MKYSVGIQGIKFCAYAALILGLAACSKGDGPGAEANSRLMPAIESGPSLPVSPVAGITSPQVPSPGTTKVVPPLSQPDWQTQTQVSLDGSVKLTREVLNESQKYALREQYRRTNLIQLPVDSRYNATLFQITDQTIEQYQHAAFIAPRIYAYQANDGASFFSHPNHDGTVTLSFNIAMIDPSRKSFRSLVQDSSIDVPEPFRAKDLDQLQSFVSRRFSLQDPISPLPGCPAKVMFNAGAHEYDITPSHFAAGDYCEINVPNQVSLTVPKAEANYIRQVALYAHMVEISAVYESRVSYPVTKVHVEFDRSHIFENLEAQLGVHTGYVDADARLSVKKVMDAQLAQVTIQGKHDQVLDQLVNRVMDEFFVKGVPDPTSDQGSCSGVKAIVCLRLNSQQLTQTSKLVFDWAEEENTLTAQNYLTSTKLSPLDKQASVLGSNDPNCQGSYCSLLSNTGSARETGLTVDEGDVLAIEPNFMIAYGRANVAPVITHTEQKVCREIRRTPCGERGSCLEWCGKEADEGPTTYTYNIGEPVPQQINSPLGKSEQLWGGLYLQFTNYGKTTECPISDFIAHSGQGDGKTLTIKLQNIPGHCEPFQGIAGETTQSLGVVSHIRWQPQEYDFGSKTLDYQGHVISNFVTRQAYQPRVDIGGKMWIVGSDFKATLGSDSLQN